MECRSIYSFSCAMCCCSLAVEIHSFVSFCGVSIYAFIYFFLCHTIHSYHTAKIFFFYIFFSIFILCDDRPTDNDEAEWTKWTNEMSGVERENDYMKAKAKGSQENEKTKMFTTLIHSIHSILNTLYLHLYTQLSHTLSHSLIHRQTLTHACLTGWKRKMKSNVKV